VTDLGEPGVDEAAAAADAELIHEELLLPAGS
jgi:hypothetical protein